MTTHEMIMLCLYLQGVGSCIPLCLVLGCLPTYGLSMLQHAAVCHRTSNFSGGTGGYPWFLWTVFVFK